MTLAAHSGPKAYLALGLALLATTGCRVGPRYTRPIVPVPGHFANAPVSSTGAADLTANGTQELRWWQGFRDSELDSLVTRAVEQNLDLAEATSRVQQSRASIGVARSGLLPSSNLNASATRNRQRFFTGLTPTGQPALRAVPYNDFLADFDASWEIDLWGRVRSDVRAANFDRAADEEDRRDVLVTLLSEIARNYTELRGTQLRLEIARRNQASERDIVSLTEVSAAAGLATERDVAQAKSALAALEATIPTLEAAGLVSASRISVLLGAPPEALQSELERPSPLPATPTSFAVGLPSDLLERRPDVRRAEAQLQAATERIGVAKADYFPRITLKATGGRDANQFHNLSLGAANIFGVGPSLTVPVFDAGKIRNNVRLEQARTEESAFKFRGAVLNALEETENALARFDREGQRLNKLTAEVEQEKTALLLSQVQYKAGLADFTAVLTAERDVEAAEDQQAQSQVLQATDLIAVYKAIGGGWDVSPTALLLKP